MSTLTFYKVFPEAILPMRADKAALGAIPASAHQYCEPVRVASGLGWYIFPPIDIRLKFNGSDVFRETDGGWEPLGVAYLPGMDEYWDQHCPPALKGHAPYYLSAVQGSRGIVQIWSGLLIGSKRGWSVNVRPLVNYPQSQLHACFEGIIETDRFKPCPLFVNLQLLATNIPIDFPHSRPLFQVQAISRQTYSAEGQSAENIIGLAPPSQEMTGFSQKDWGAYRKTIRTDAPEDDHRAGQYASSVRKRTKLTR
jgi:hypothetical protein